MDSSEQKSTNVCSTFKFFCLLLVVTIILAGNFSAHYHQRIDYQTSPVPIPRVEQSSAKPNTLNKPPNVLDGFLSEEDQFMTFLDIRRACLSVLNVFAFKHPIHYKLNYLNFSLIFIREKFAKFQSLRSDERKTLQRLLKSLDGNLKCLKMARNGFGEQDCQSSTESSHLTERYFVSQMGAWYNYLKKIYLQFSHKHHKQCRIKIEEQRKLLLERIAYVQFGSTCKNSKTVLHLRMELKKSKFVITALKYSR